MYLCEQFGPLEKILKNIPYSHVKYGIHAEFIGI